LHGVLGEPAIEKFDDKLVLLNAGKVDFPKLIYDAKTEYELLNVCARIGIMYSLPYFSILQLPIDNSRDLSSIQLVSNWPCFLVQDYDKHGLLESSPVIAHLKKSTEPLIYDVKKINQNRAGDQKDIVTELFNKHNIYHGVYFCVHLSNGKVGAVSFSGDKNIFTDKDHLADSKLLELNYLSNLIFSKANALRDEPSVQSFDLKKREIECLQLSSKGKTSSEIGEYLGLSEHTVNMYMDNAMLKLETKNKIHTVCKALRLKMIN